MELLPNVIERTEASVNSEDRGSSRCGSAVVNPTSIHEDVGLILGLAQGVKDPALP